MGKEEMRQSILEALSRKLGGSYRVSIQQILKTNQKLDGLTILQEGTHISPTVYLDAFYTDLRNGIPLNDVVNSILQVYDSTKIYPGHFDVSAITDFGYVKSHLYVELINRHLNRELLQDIPHTLFLDDFAVTVRCLIGAQAEETASFLVHNGHLGIWQIGQAELIPLAIQNTREMLGLDIRGISDVIAELCTCDLEAGDAGTPMWVMTNRQKLSGASTALFDDALKEFAAEHGSFYVIFSSLHEVLLLPTPDCSNINEITRINQQVNATQVQVGEVLGTKAYFYNKDNGFTL